MFIDFCVCCHNFQRRLIWQLSSMIEQTCDMSDVQIRVSSMKDNGSPSTEKVVEYFKGLGLNVVHRVMEDTNIFAKRGLVRNIDVKESKAEWMFFSDCDNVYAPNFFTQLKEYLETSTVTNCITSIAKYHTDVGATNKIMECSSLDAVSDSYKGALAIPMIEKRNKRTAAGCMQVVKRSEIIEDTYVYNSNDKHLFKKGQHALSDKQFRRKQGGSTFVKLAPQVHLNHFRDKEVGYHLETQR